MKLIKKISLCFSSVLFLAGLFLVSEKNAVAATMGCCVRYEDASKAKIGGCFYGTQEVCSEPLQEFFNYSGCYQSDTPEKIRKNCKADPVLGSGNESAAIADTNDKQYGDVTKPTVRNLSNGEQCYTNGDCLSGYCSGDAFETPICADKPFLSGIVPCGRNSGPIEVQQRCTLCHLVIGIQGLIQWGLKVMIPVALVMIMIGGVYYVVSAGNESMMESAKKFITSVAIGVAVMLGGWVIINTTLYIIGSKSDLGVNEGLSRIKARNWYTFECNVASQSGTGLDAFTGPREDVNIVNKK